MTHQTIFSGDVYWIPKSSPLFHIICDWSRTTVKQAEGLRAVYQFDDIHGIAPLFRREPFCHSWDLTTQEAIYQEAREEIYRYCREDRELLLGTIEHLLLPEHKAIADRIIQEWDEQQHHKKG